MLEKAQGDYICRWDDDDISLPWRLAASIAKLYGTDIIQRDFVPPKNMGPLLAEWRPENHWYSERNQIVKQTIHPGNTHIMAIWHRRLIEGLGVNYPGAPCPSGHEDQTFNRHIWNLGYPYHGTVIPPQDIFYIYRFGTGAHHLTASDMQANYDAIGQQRIIEGEFTLHPRWTQDYVTLAADAASHH